MSRNTSGCKSNLGGNFMSLEKKEERRKTQRMAYITTYSEV